MIKSVLITGVFGFLGTHVLNYYKKQGFYVAGIGRSDTIDHENILSLDAYCMDSITLENMLTFDHKFDVIVHCAGSGSVGKSIENPLKEFSNTLEATQVVLEYIKMEQPQARLVFTSSAAVYGSSHTSPIKESVHIDPMSLYGVHKDLSEQLCKYYAKLYDVKISVIRFFSIYGPGLQKQLLWDTCNKITNSKDETLIFFGTGGEIRDFIEIDDALDLIGNASIATEPFLVINGGTGEVTSVSKIIHLLAKLLSCEIEISFNNSVRKGDPEYLCADIAKAMTYKWKPKVTLMEGVKKYVTWYQQRK